jgi:DNA-binding MarR family transcriptional regulator
MERAQLINKIMQLQRQLGRALRQCEPDAWTGLNLTIAQLKTLFFITRQGSTNSSKLAAALGVTPADTTGLVDRLVARGLVSRTDNPEDRRMLSLQATAKGEALVTKLRGTTMSLLSDVLARMSVDELATLAQGIIALVKAAEAHVGEIKDEHD